MSCTVGGSLVSTAALSFGASAIRRAIIMNVCARVVRNWSTTALVAKMSRRMASSASRVTLTLTRYTATPIESTASSALVRKMRLRSEDSTFIAA